jgi:PhnB protein
MKKHTYIPEGYNAVMPALAFKDAASAIKWYEKVFDAKEKMLLRNPDNTVGHGEITIGDTLVMVSEENPQYNKSPKTLNGNSVNLCMYVPDVDAVVQKAIDNGAKLVMPVEDQFYGESQLCGISRYS